MTKTNFIYYKIYIYNTLKYIKNHLSQYTIIYCSRYIFNKHISNDTNKG